MGLYYPVAMAVLLVRLDEGLDELPAEAIATLEGDLSGRFQFLPGAEGWLQAAEMTTGTGNQADASRVFALRTYPTQISIRRNSYRNADECSLTIPWEDCPLDSQSIRSISVAVYMGCVDAATWGRSVLQGVSLGKSPWGRDTVDLANLIAQPKNLRFTGFHDEINESHGEGGDMLRLSCRDWTKLLIDTPVPSSVYRAIQWDDPIEDVITQVLASIACFEGTVLHLVGVEPGTVATKSLRGMHHRAGKSKRRPSRAPKVKAEKYWDLLTDLSVMAGLVMYADPWAPDGSIRPRFVLQRPADLYSGDVLSLWENQIVRDPSGGKLIAKGWTVRPEGLPTFASKNRLYPGTNDRIADAPVLIYGSDLASVEFGRRNEHEKIPSVELVCVQGKKTFRYRYPQGARPADVHPSGMWAQDQVRVIPVSGAESVEELKTVAEQIFEELGRGERTCTIETQELASFGGDNSDPDLLDLRAGASIEVLFAREVESGSTDIRCRIEAMSETELARWFVEVRRLPARAANSLARVLKGPRANELLQRRWYVREATLDFSSDDGISVRAEALDYLNARVTRENRAAQDATPVPGGQVS